MIEENIAPMPTFHGHNLRLAEGERAMWVALVSSRTEYEHLLDPAFWANVAEKLLPRARIEVWREDNEWFAEFVVLESQRTWARVYPIGYWPLRRKSDAPSAATQAIQAAFDQHRTDFRGTRGWCVIRNRDNEPVAENMATKDDAEDWLQRWARENPPVPPPPALEAVPPVEGLRPGRGSE